MEILRYAAFSSDPAGGNPAGVVLDATGATDARDAGGRRRGRLLGVGLPRPAAGRRRSTVRYFSPLAEVPFCGHATIAAAVAYAERHGPGRLALQTRAGRSTSRPGWAPTGRTRRWSACHRGPQSWPGRLQDELLSALGWSLSDLDRTLPTRVAYAGAFHPVVAATSGLAWPTWTTTSRRWVDDGP